MKRIIIPTAIAGLLATAAFIAQAAPPAASPAIRSVRSAGTGFPIGINQPQHNDDTNNPEHKPIIVVAYCNATAGRKDLEGVVGQNQPLSLDQMVASSTGPERLSITFVVPYDWWYEVSVNHPPENTVGLPVGGKCLATGWWTY